MTNRPPFKQLLAPAQAEVATALADLPCDLRDKAQSLPVTYEPKPTPGMAEDDIAIDTLGLFCGEALNDPPSSLPVPHQIILFLENIWDFAGAREKLYCHEIRTTYLHELGHYFGFDEDELTSRSLD